jgi:hypothetical protein
LEVIEYIIPHDKLILRRSNTQMIYSCRIYPLFYKLTSLVTSKVLICGSSLKANVAFNVFKFQRIFCGVTTTTTTKPLIPNKLR